MKQKAKPKKYRITMRVDASYFVDDDGRKYFLREG